MGIYKNTILPRSIFIPFFFAHLILSVINLFTANKFRRAGVATLICLESGIKGWDLIEYKELLNSAQEYLGCDRVIKVSINKETSYFDQVSLAVKLNKPSHYLYDARTGSQHWLQGLIQAFRVAILFQSHGVVPICTLTDLPVRKWRAQTAIVTAKRGVVLSLMSPRDIGKIFPHDRLIGPMTMPFSMRTFNFLKDLAVENYSHASGMSLVFMGSMYEPRATILNEIKGGLSERGINLEIHGRELGSEKFSDEDYWVGLMRATVVITTANQISTPSNDWAWIPHLIYRYLEVTASGSLLVAQEVPSLGRFFKPGVHYISYKSPSDAIEKIEYYWKNRNALDKIATQGQERAKNIISSNLFWISVDIGLRKYPLI